MHNASARGDCPAHLLQRVGRHPIFGARGFFRRDRPEEFGADWTDYPNIARWLEAIAALPGWVHPYKLMPGHPLPAKS